MRQLPSYTEMRRRALAQRLAHLDALEARSMITESLGIFAAGIGLAAAGMPRRPMAAEFAATPVAGRARVGDLTPPEARGQATGGRVGIGGTDTLLARIVPAGSRAGRPRTTEAIDAGAPGVVAISATPSPSGGASAPPIGGPSVALAAPGRPADPTRAEDVAGAAAAIPALLAALASPGASGTGATSSSGGAGSSPESGAKALGGLGIGGPGGGVVALSTPASGAFDYFPLYTLDYNHGTVLFPGAAQIGVPGEAVDLRAQVRLPSGASSATYSWNTSGLTHATSISGSSTSRLQFSWNAFPVFPSGVDFLTDTATLTVTAGGNSEVQTYTFIIPRVQANTAASAPSWPAFVPYGSTRPEAAIFPDHYVDVVAATGAVRTAISLPAYSPNIAPLTFRYDSTSTYPEPIIVVRYTIPSPVPATVYAAFNGTAYGATTYDTSDLVPGDVIQIALQAVSAGIPGGYYNTPIDVTPAGGSTVSISAYAVALDSYDSPFGIGWSLDGLAALYPVSGTGVVLDVGGGDALWFAGAGPSYTSPAGDFSTLVKNVGGDYTRTLPDGTVQSFNSSGQLTVVTDRNSLATTYAYSSGRLSTITDPYAKLTTFSYDPYGFIANVTDPASRVTTFTHTGFRKLTAVTLPGDTNSWLFGYGGPTSRSSQLTSVTDPNFRDTIVTSYDSAHRAATITRPDGTTTTYSAAQVAGFAPSGSGTVPAVLLAEVAAKAADPYGKVTSVRPDWSGLGLPGQTIDPLQAITTYDRNAAGLPVARIDPVNRIEQVAYDSVGNPKTMVHGDLATETAAYNGYGEPTRFTNGRGYTTTYTYDGSGNLTGVLDALGGRATYTYTGNGRLQAATDPNNHTTSYAYDSQDRLTTITEPDAGAGTSTRLFGYSSAGNVTSTTDERGNVTTASYDAQNRLTGATDALGNRTTVVYDLAGNPTALQAPLSRTTTYAYDAMNRLTTVTTPLSRVTAYGYDSNGRRTTVVDPMGRITTTTYDDAGRPTVITAPLSRVTTMTYNAAGEVTRVADPLGRVTTTTYDGRGRVATVTDPLGFTITYSYTATGFLERKVRENSTTLADSGTNYQYDALDRLTAVTDALNHTTSFGYDAAGNRIADTSPLNGTITTTYDARNNPITVTDPLIHTATYGYDVAGNPTTVTDPLGHTTTTSYDALNRATTVTDARGGIATIGYDAASRRTLSIDPVGNRTTIAYDAADRVTTLTDAIGTATFTYNADDELVDRTDRAGRRTTFAYDGGGRLVNERWLGGGGSILRTITYTYDADDEMTGAADPDSLLTFTYDGAGNQLTAATSSSAGQPTVTLTSAYDAVGNRTSLADNLASVGRTTYSYDNAFRLTTIARSVGGTAGPQVVYDYDAAGRLTSIRRADNGGSGTAVLSTLVYDAASRLVTMTHRVDGGAMLATYVYGYDAADRVTTETNAEGTVAFTYDDTDELTAVGGARTESYGYDLAGNRNTTGYSTGSGNKLTASPGATYTYDSEGNRSGMTDTTTGATTTYAYDHRDRLTGITIRSSGGSITHQVTYTYDALDRRIGTKTDGTQTWTVYDGQNTYADFDGSGSLATRYLYGPGIDNLLARTSSGGTTSWYLQDRVGSVRDIASASGSVIDHITYDSFGNTLSESSPSNGDRFKFAAREYDATAAIYNNRERPLDTRTGSFLRTDDKNYQIFYSSYIYVSNSPTNFIDPAGAFQEPTRFGYAELEENSGQYFYGPTGPYGIYFNPPPEGPVNIFQIGELNQLANQAIISYGGRAQREPGPPILGNPNAVPTVGPQSNTRFSFLPGITPAGSISGSHTFSQANTTISASISKNRVIVGGSTQFSSVYGTGFTYTSTGTFTYTGSNQTFFNATMTGTRPVGPNGAQTISVGGGFSPTGGAGFGISTEIRFPVGPHRPQPLRDNPFYNRFGDPPRGERRLFRDLMEKIFGW